MNLLSLRPNKQIHPQVNHHYVIAQVFKQFFNQLNSLNWRPKCWVISFNIVWCWRHCKLWCTHNVGVDIGKLCTIIEIMSWSLVASNHSITHGWPYLYHSTYVCKSQYALVYHKIKVKTIFYSRSHMALQCYHQH